MVVPKAFSLAKTVTITDLPRSIVHLSYKPCNILKPRRCCVYLYVRVYTYICTCTRLVISISGCRYLPVVVLCCVVLVLCLIVSEVC